MKASLPFRLNDLYVRNANKSADIHSREVNHALQRSDFFDANVHRASDATNNIASERRLVGSFHPSCESACDRNQGCESKYPSPADV